MTTNKKLSLIFLVAIVIPIMLPVLFDCFYRDKYFYGYSCSSTSFVVFSFLPFLGGLIINYLNYKKGYNSKIWYFVASLVIVVFGLYFYSLYSLSNFGF